MPLTADQVRFIAGPVCPEANAAACAPALQEALMLADALTVTRAAAMLAQIVWETGQLRFLVEGEEPATAYEGRASLGNTEKGDGVRYRGRGFFHLTGRANYRAAGAAIGVPLEAQPDFAAELQIVPKITAWYWQKHALNGLADARDFRGITERINGKATEGPPSYHERREKYYRAALEVLGLSARLG